MSSKSLTSFNRNNKITNTKLTASASANLSKSSCNLNYYENSTNPDDEDEISLNDRVKLSNSAYNLTTLAPESEGIYEQVPSKLVNFRIDKKNLQLGSKSSPTFSSSPPVDDQNEMGIAARKALKSMLSTNSENSAYMYSVFEQIGVCKNLMNTDYSSGK